MHTHRTTPVESANSWRQASLLPAFVSPWFCQKNLLFYLPNKIQRGHAIIYVLQEPVDYNILLENVTFRIFVVFRFGSFGLIIQDTVLTKCSSMSWPRTYSCSIPSFLLELENQTVFQKSQTKRQGEGNLVLFFTLDLPLEMGNMLFWQKNLKKSMFPHPVQEL